MKQNLQLADILQIVWKEKFKILLFTALAFIAGALLYTVLPKKYESHTNFIVRPPYHGMRGSIIGQDRPEAFYDIFANEKDIDLAEGILKSGFFFDKISYIVNENLADYDLTERIPTKEIVKSLKFKRSALRVQNLRVLHHNNTFAQKLGVLMMKELNVEYNKYFTQGHEQKQVLLENEIETIESKLAALDLEIEEYRKEHNLNVELAPQRSQYMLSNNSSTVKEGTEHLYNLTQKKEALLKTLNQLHKGAIEFEALSKDEAYLDMIHIVAGGYVAEKTTYPNFYLVLLISGALGFFISVLGIIISYIPKN